MDEIEASSKHCHQPVAKIEDKQCANSTSIPCNYLFLSRSLVQSFVLQMIFLLFFCREGKSVASIQMTFALMFDSFVLLRILIAWLRKECDRSWLFYAILLYTSPLWISSLFNFLAELK